MKEQTFFDCVMQTLMDCSEQVPGQNNPRVRQLKQQKRKK